MKKYLWSMLIVLVLASLVFAMPAKQPTGLAWLAPTENNNGTPITNLAGYKVYWASVSGNYSDAQSKDVGNVLTVNIVDVTGSVTDVYYFVVTAYITSGQESDFSNEVRNDVPLVPAAPGNLKILQ